MELREIAVPLHLWKFGNILANNICFIQIRPFFSSSKFSVLPSCTILREAVFVLSKCESLKKLYEKYITLYNQGQKLSSFRFSRLISRMNAASIAKS